MMKKIIPFLNHFLFPMTQPSSSKSSSHIGVGLAAGAIVGLAAGLFLQSRKGKALTKDAQKKMIFLQKQVMKKLKQAEHLSKEAYEEIVEDILGFYVKSKELAAKELPQARSFLLKRWKDIQRELEQVTK